MCNSVLISPISTGALGHEINKNIRLVALQTILPFVLVSRMCPTPKPAEQTNHCPGKTTTYLKYDLRDQKVHVPLSHDKERSWLRRKDFPDRYGPIT
jgi:hypothetical protein